MDKQERRDEISGRLFRIHYSALSAWGQAHVDTIISAGSMIDEKKVDAPWNQRLPNMEDSLAMQNEKLARIVDDLRQENFELWEENEELKLKIGKEEV